MEKQTYEIDINALKKVYQERHEDAHGDTFVVLEWQNLEKLHKHFIHLNKQIDKIYGEMYEPYIDNLHITIIGLDGYRELSREDRDTVDSLLGDFPELTVKNAQFKLLKNGLVVSEIELSEASQEKLACFRKGLELFGISYKYPDKIRNLHSVLGIFNPEQFTQKSFEASLDQCKAVIEDAQQCAKFGDGEVVLSSENVLRVRYALKSLKNLDHFFKQKIEEYLSESFLEEEMDDDEKYDATRKELQRIEELLKRSNNIDILNKELQRFVKELKSSVYNSAPSRFWRMIDLQIIHDRFRNIDEYNFAEYTFPAFNDRSFIAVHNDKRHMVFSKPVIFLKTKFYGEVSFQKALFEQKVSFNIAYFYEKVKIRSCRFLGETYFRKTYFFNEADFEASHFKNVALDGITFPEDNKIKMVRTTFENVIWSNFINPNDVLKIESERETFARLKQANSERGNFIDSNLFFVEESNIYLKNIKEKLFCIPKKDRTKEDPNKKCPKWIKKFGFLGDYISFGIAKITSNFGKSWFIPLAWFWALFVIALFVFAPNRDFIATPATPKFLMQKDTNKTDASEIPDIETAYFQKNYYDGYNFEFQDDSEMRLKDTLATRSMYVFGSLAPTVLASNQWFSTIRQDRFMMRAVLTILFWYFLGAFLYALKNRTKRN